jgi:2'-5' RNA ligase
LKGGILQQLPEQIRSFVAIELPSEVKAGLASLRHELERHEHTFIKWVDPDAIHLTLKFLGNIPSKQVTRITKAIEEAAQGISQFHLEISQLGAFPNLKQPRVLWVGIGGELDKLLSLQRRVDSALAHLGFAKEERAFAPHLTIARLRERTSPVERKNFGELAMSSSPEIKYHIDVKDVSFIRSQLTPSGAIYTRLSIVELAAGQNQ